MAVSATITSTQLARLGEAIAERGAGVHEHELAVIARQAGRHIGPLAAIDVMVDRAAAPVARERAFAVVASAMAAAGAAARGGEVDVTVRAA
jgi:hypothetical protein